MKKILIAFLLILPLQSKESLRFQAIKEHGILSKSFLETLRNKFDITVLIETGTYLGGTAELASIVFKEVYSVELSRDLYEKVKNKFSNKSNIKLYNDSSENFLNNILGNLKNEKLLIYLDAHWSLGNTTKIENKNTPVLDELHCIKNAGITNAIIIIDDARFFQSKSIVQQQEKLHADPTMYGYPTIKKINKFLKLINPSYEIYIFGDAIVCIPGEIEKSPLVDLMTNITMHYQTKEYINDKAFIDQEKEVIFHLTPSESNGIKSLYNQGLTNPAIFAINYRIWNGVLALAENRIAEAKKVFTDIKATKFKSDRIDYYCNLLNL